MCVALIQVIFNGKHTNVSRNVRECGRDDLCNDTQLGSRKHTLRVLPHNY
jgi:hypothetical protein